MEAAPQRPIPSELMLPAPRPLPRWARSRTLFVLLAAASAVLVLAVAFVAIEDGASAIIPAAVAAVIAGTLVVHVQTRVSPLCGEAEP